MTSRVARALIALVLVVATLPMLTSSVNAGEPRILFFPWVVNGVAIDDQRGFDSLGPFYASVTISNPTIATLVVEYSVIDGPLPDPMPSFELEAFESRTLTADEIGIPAGTGRGAIFLGHWKVSDTPAPISGVLKQASPVPLTDVSGTGTQHDVVGGYTALPWTEMASDVILPVAQTNTNWNTRIHVTHVEGLPQDVTISLSLQEAGGGDMLGPFDLVTGPGGTVTFDLLDLGVPEGWVGSALINASSGVVAVAERVKNETSMLIMNTARKIPGPGNEQYAPLIFRDWFNWNTGISLANLSAAENDIIVRFYDGDGIEVRTDLMTIPGNGMDFLHFPALDGGEAFLGSALIEGSEPFVGAVDEVKYLGDDGDTGHAMSYMVEPEEVAMVSARLTLALFQRGNSLTSGGDTSGIQLFNPTHLQAQYSYGIYAQDGTTMLGGIQGPFISSPKENTTLYAFDINGLPDGFTGSIQIFLPSGSGLTGVSNNVNYDVEFDGSASFNLVKVTGLE